MGRFCSMACDAKDLACDINAVLLAPSLTALEAAGRPKPSPVFTNTPATVALSSLRADSARKSRMMEASPPNRPSWAQMSTTFSIRDSIVAGGLGRLVPGFGVSLNLSLKQGKAEV